jgi:methylated-DNA-[protein]-cysteine S-methyltransferase
MEVTKFQSRVYEALRLVPRGYVTTYKALADAIGCKSPRAVGQALKHNPYAPEVPCHRVIATDLSIGGFHGNREGRWIARKRQLLQHEGVELVDGHLADPTYLYNWQNHEDPVL